MKCEDLTPYLVDELTLGDGSDELHTHELGTHLETCAACRTELESLRRIWAGLGQLADEAPSEAMRQRFYTMLEAYRHGLESRPPTPAEAWRELLRRFEAWLAGWWPQRRLWQLAMTAAALLAGIALGARWAAPDRSGDELVALQGEVVSLHRLVSLSLLDHESASERLRGVGFSQRGAHPGEEIFTALLGVLDDDPNVSVRLATVDALGRYLDRPDVADALRRTLPRQRSPLVQLALVDLLLEANGPASRKVVEELLEEPLDNTVREFIRERLGPRI